ncbi:hypothetical protein C8A05DRAFT_38634 [Staphylotrichum tortipilum]|uniref:Uncharacterized protein n=1 Tax=Staphylotrichum tortipilum TaxID=2831512 RepID=A0AAN6MB88_9PEZI|nr:hypothetical protein C8A05DRAFT_38634 [Staphylotrichum longicolle]
MAAPLQANCSALSQAKDFHDYIDLLRQQTSFERARLIQCRAEICSASALWGRDNPDIAGLGVAIGYALCATLSFLLALATHLLFPPLHPVPPGSITPPLTPPDRPSKTRFQKALLRTFTTFSDTALYFTLALQLATTVFLAQRDFGVAPDGFGAADAQIALAVSVLGMVPLMYPVGMLPVTGGREKKMGGEKDTGDAGEGEEEEEEGRGNLRLFLFGLVVVLFFYPFLSQGVHMWGPSRIGGGVLAGQEEWDKLRGVCLEGVRELSQAGSWVLAVVMMVASLVVLVFTGWVMIGRLGEGGEGAGRKEGYGGGRGRRGRRGFWGDGVGWVRGVLKVRSVQWVLLAVPLVLAIPLLYFLFELRAIQEELTVSLGGVYTGNDWGFGQVISILMFAPVLVEFVYSLMYL